MLGIMKMLTRWLLLAGALLLVAHLYPGVVVTSFTSALVAALVLGLLNTIVRPLLVLLTLPATRPGLRALDPTDDPLDLAAGAASA